MWVFHIFRNKLIRINNSNQRVETRAEWCLWEGSVPLWKYLGGFQPGTALSPCLRGGLCSRNAKRCHPEHWEPWGSQAEKEVGWWWKQKASRYCVYMEILPNPQFLSVFKTLHTAPLNFFWRGGCTLLWVLTNPLSLINTTTINMQNSPLPKFGQILAFKLSVVIVTLWVTDKKKH